MVSNLPPEIQRCDASSLILKLKALGIKNLITFDYFSAPKVDNLIRGLELLHALGALDNGANLTQPKGLQMAELSSLDPRLSAAILTSNSEKLKVCAEVITIAALMSVSQQLFYTPKKQSEFGGDH